MKKFTFIYFLFVLNNIIFSQGVIDTLKNITETDFVPDSLSISDSTVVIDSLAKSPT